MVQLLPPAPSNVWWLTTVELARAARPRHRRARVLRAPVARSSPDRHALTSLRLRTLATRHHSAGDRRGNRAVDHIRDDRRHMAAGPMTVAYWPVSFWIGTGEPAPSEGRATKGRQGAWYLDMKSHVIAPDSLPRTRSSIIEGKRG